MITTRFMVGVDQGAYDKIKTTKRGAGGRISLQDYMAVGGNLTNITRYMVMLRGL